MNYQPVAKRSSRPPIMRRLLLGAWLAAGLGIPIGLRTADPGATTADVAWAAVAGAVLLLAAAAQPWDPRQRRKDTT